MTREMAPPTAANALAGTGCHPSDLFKLVSARERRALHQEDLHHDGGGICRQCRPVGKDCKGRHKVRPPAPVCDRLPDQGGRDVEPLSTGSFLLIVVFQPPLQNHLFRLREPDNAGTEERLWLVRGARKEEHQNKCDKDREDALH